MQQKQYRNLHNICVVEGEKGVREFLNSEFELHSLFCTDGFKIERTTDKIYQIAEKELDKISQLKTPNKVLGIFYKPKPKILNKKGLILVLDNIKDPGNLGTIIRLCDWFNIAQLICSLETVDCFNPKVVQATMGSLTRVSIVYTDIIEVLKNTDLPCFAAVMNGKSDYKTKLQKDYLLIMGNEDNGISESGLKETQHHLAIPRFNAFNKPESLNVATATAILLSEFKRPVIQKLD